MSSKHIPWPSEKFKQQFTDRMLCATSADPYSVSSACQGDSGGPLVREVYLIEYNAYTTYQHNFIDIFLILIEIDQYNITFAY